jgi:hypothetical protein
MNIMSVTETLDKYNYQYLINKNDELIFENYSLIIDKKYTLSKEQYDYILKGFLNGQFLGDIELLASQILAKAIFENNPNLEISKQEKEKFFLKITEILAFDFLSYRKIYANILNNDTNIRNCCGINRSGNIYLSRKSIEGDPQNLIVTIFHELRHSKQYFERETNHILSLKSLIQIKDYVLASMIPNYEKINYGNLSYEKEAFFYEYDDAIDYLRFLKVDISKHLMTMHSLSKEHYSNYNDDQYREYNHHTYNLDAIFEFSVVYCPEILEKYPQLNFEYKIENNLVVPKTLEEIKNDYENYQNNILNWKGDREEINNLYQRKIALLNNESKKI